MKKLTIPIKFFFGLMLAAFMLLCRPAWAADVLILSTTDPSNQARNAALAEGLTYDVVTPTVWSGMTAAQFAAYKAIVLADPTCGPISAISAPLANRAVWGPVITGNVILIGTDEALHNKPLVSRGGIKFAASSPGKTGAYISLGCYYHGVPALTPVPLLDVFGGPGSFTMTGVGCYNIAHIVATHPALASLTDAYLSNWSCSVHEAFDTWPIGFEVLAIAQGVGTRYTATDGSVGTPYILARGVTVISDINLDPDSATNPVGTSHTVTATVAEDGTPIVGTTVTFTVILGPNTGVTGTGVTNGSGQATFSYSSAVAGTDTIEATFVDSLGRTQRSDRVTKEWRGLPPISCNAGTDFSVNEAKSFGLDGSASSGGVAPLSFSWTEPLPLTGENTATPTGTAPVVSGNQDHTFVLTVSDSAGQTATCDVVLTVIDSDLPPNCSSATASPALLWPPNHKLNTISVTGVVDEESGASIAITGVSQDEPSNGLGDGDTGPDAALDGATARVRAERSGLEDGRVVHLSFTATDTLGQSCRGEVTVGIPHDKKDIPVDSAPPAYDATVE